MPELFDVIEAMTSVRFAAVVVAGDDVASVLLLLLLLLLLLVDVFPGHMRAMARVYRADMFVEHVDSVAVVFTVEPV